MLGPEDLAIYVSAFLLEVDFLKFSVNAISLGLTFSETEAAWNLNQMNRVVNGGRDLRGGAGLVAPFSVKELEGLWGLTLAAV